MIEINGVTKHFGKKTAVSGLDLHIGKGEVFGFLGPNGAGKTTTMKMILGLLRPDSGQISLFNERAGSLEARRRIGFLPEFANYYQHLTGREFLVFVGEIFGLEKQEIKKRTEKMLALVNIASEAQDRPVGTYSKGMQQRIGMAQSLMNDPDILFLDEPMSGLDPLGRREMKNLILELKRQGKTVFFNSHILADAQEICDTIGIIHLGQLLVSGSVKTIVPPNKSLEDIFIETITMADNSSSKVADSPKRKTVTKKEEAAISVKKNTTSRKAPLKRKMPAQSSPKVKKED